MYTYTYAHVQHKGRRRDMGGSQGINERARGWMGEKCVGCKHE